MKTSTFTTLFAVYFFIGILLMIFAVASRGNRERTNGYMPTGGGDGLDFALMVFIALLWPVWLISLLSKDEPKK